MFNVGPAPAEIVVKDQVTAPDRIHPFGGLASARPVVKVQAVQLRHWADTSEWVRAAINHRRVQVSQSSWGIVPIDDKAKFDPKLQATIELLLLHPNNKQKSFRALIEPVIEDILVLDRGVIEKEITVGGSPVALYLVDGASIRTNPRWSGDPNDPRYSWWPNNVFVSNLLDTQIVLMMANPTSHRVDGFSPLEALKATIDADLAARDFNTRMVRQTSPNGILNLGENVGANVVDSFRVYWDAEVAGKKQMGIIGGVKNPDFIKLGQTARDMQYMQWQVYLLRKIAAVFGIAPQDLGITFDVNRANATTQQELSEDRGLKPLLRLIEEEINAKVIADFARTKAKQAWHAGEIDVTTMRLAIALTHISPRDHADVFRKLHAANVLNLAFKYRLRSAKNTRDQADYNRWALGGIPWDTVNEVRAEDGKGPVEGGDTIIVMTPIGAMPLDMIGGSMVPQTEDQKRYLDGLFQNAPLVLGRGSAVAGTPPVAVAGTQERAPEPVVVTQTVEVDEDGDEVED
jgi:HK97 family phage portal protein